MEKKPLSVYSFRLSDELIEEIWTKFPNRSVKDIIRELLEELVKIKKCPTCGSKLK